MYRTLYFRWVTPTFCVLEQIINYLYFSTRYVSQKKFLELEGMLFDGALLLFSHQETASGVIKAFIDVIFRSGGQYFENDSLLGGSCQTVC